MRDQVAYMSDVLGDGRLFVGNRYAAEAFGKKVADGWTCITCTEYRDRGELPNEPEGSIDIRFTAFDDTARPEFLDAIARRIDESLKVDKKVLVHCVQGCERSPLAIVWYLIKSGRFTTVENAYSYLMKRHPSTGDRRTWLKGAVPVPFATDAPDVLETPTPIDMRKDRRTLLGLCMIVKDEEGGIAATLRSIKPWVDRWVIYDTGSTDNTPEIIKTEMAGVPGVLLTTKELGEFGNFSAARNRALEAFELHYGAECPFVFMPDADDVLHGGKELREFLRVVPPDAPEPAYLVRLHRSAELDYYLPLVMRVRDKARYTGRVHEVLSAATVRAISQPVKLTHNFRAFSDLQRKQRWLRDKEWLQQDVVENPNNARAWFYLAQTCECLGDVNAALEWYERHFAVGSFHDEMYESLFRIADLKEKHAYPRADVHAAYMRAFNFDPRRAEPLYRIARDHATRDEHGAAFFHALHAASLPMPNTIMFMDREVYEHKAADLVATHAYYVHQKTKNGSAFAMGRVFAEKCVRARPDEGRYRQNRAFYAPSATARYNATMKAIDYAPAWPFHPSNPSIHYDQPTKQWRCVLRTVNYKIENGRYLTPTAEGGYAEVGPENAIYTRNVMLELSPSLDITRAVPMDDLTVRDTVSTREFPVRGYEDLRFYIFDDKDGRHMRATATVCDWAGAPGGVGQRELVELGIEWPTGKPDVDYAIWDVRRLPLPEACKKDHQKNWMPIVPTRRGEPPTWIFAVHHKPVGHKPSLMFRNVIRYIAGDKNTLCELATSEKLGRLRGGSQAIYISDEYTGQRGPAYLCLMHDVVMSGQHRLYLHRFVLISKTRDRVLAMSPHFYFKKLGIEFCAGLAGGPGPDGSIRLVASFSVDDSHAYFATFDLNDVIASLDDNYFV